MRGAVSCTRWPRCSTRSPSRSGRRLRGRPYLVWQGVVLRARAREAREPEGDRSPAEEQQATAHFHLFLSPLSEWDFRLYLCARQCILRLQTNRPLDALSCGADLITSFSRLLRAEVGREFEAAWLLGAAADLGRLCKMRMTQGHARDVRKLKENHDKLAARTLTRFSPVVALSTFSLVSPHLDHDACSHLPPQGAQKARGEGCQEKGGQGNVIACLPLQPC